MFRKLSFLSRGCRSTPGNAYSHTANLPTNIVDFRGFDSSIMLIVSGGIPRPIADFPKGLTQAMLVGTMLVGRLGAVHLSGLGRLEPSFRIELLKLLNLRTVAHFKMPFDC